MILLNRRFTFESAPGFIRVGRMFFCFIFATLLFSSVANATFRETRYMTFSIDVQGPTAGTGVPDSFNWLPIRGTDILTPFWPGPPGPNRAELSGQLPLSQPGIYIRPDGMPSPFLDIFNGWGEGDALSYGNDPMDEPTGNCFGYGCLHIFSVDEFAIGLPGTDLRLEGALGRGEAAADTFRSHELELPTAPLQGWNRQYTDGDGIGLGEFPFRGIGLVEPPNPATALSSGRPGQIVPGDNLDAVDFGKKIDDVGYPFYASLDSIFLDPLETFGAPPNYATAAANGIVGGDVVLVTEESGFLYASASQLGLDIFGPDTDDLDALKLLENGVGGYQQSIVPFDWISGQTDMLLFSVRRNSSTISILDSILGLPIEEGDILTTSCPAGSVLPDGTVCVGGSAPGIFVAAESLGLATVRSGTAMSYGVINPIYGRDVWADDLDAYDQVVPEPRAIELLVMGFIGVTVAVRRRGFSAH